MFYLQNTSDGIPLTVEHTLATSKVSVVDPRTGSLSASPNPIPVAAGATAGTTTVSWTSSHVTTVQVRVGAPDGPLAAQSGAGPNSFTTGPWVSDGKKFYLQDVSNGLPLTSRRTLATTTVRLASGSITGTPNPAFLDDGTGKAVMTLSWTSRNTKVAEVHLGSPDGTRVAQSGPGDGSTTTGKWITNGMKFYLQDVSSGRPLTSRYTLAVFAAQVQGGTLTATPNPIRVPDGGGKGVTTLQWTTTGTQHVEVRRGSPAGSLVSRSEPGTHSATTGKWVTYGTVFFLQDVSGDRPLTADHTVATVSLGVVTPMGDLRATHTLTATAYDASGNTSRYSVALSTDYRVIAQTS